jgi:hypothetical protein
MNEFVTIDISELWKIVSSFAVVEDVDKYIKKLDDQLEKISENSTLVFVGKSPIWLYCIMSCRVVSQRPDIILHYSKPTTYGHRKFKLYPW